MTKPAFTWRLDGVPQVARSLNGLSNVLVAVTLSVTGTRSGISASRATGVVTLTQPDPASFKPWTPTTEGGPYVTEADAVAWGKAALAADNGFATVQGLEDEIEADIAAKEQEAADLAKPVEMPFYTPPPAPEEEGAPAQ